MGLSWRRRAAGRAQRAGTRWHCAGRPPRLAAPDRRPAPGRRRWDATPKVIAIVGAMQLGIILYAFQAPGISKAVFGARRGEASAPAAAAAGALPMLPVLWHTR
jgi:hypothetical protein